MFVEFLIPTYNRIYPLNSMLASLLAQTDRDWQATVIVDNVNIDVIGFLTVPIDERIIYKNMDKRYNDYGHTLREVYKQLSTSEYLVMTGDDNYYTPNFVAELRKNVVTKPGFVYWDMVHSHFDYKCFASVPAHGRIDMGAFATRTDLAKQIKLNTGFAADGDFVEDFNRKFPKEQKIHIQKTLFIHN